MAAGDGTPGGIGAAAFLHRADAPERVGGYPGLIAAPDAPERPTFGLLGKVVLIALAAFGALMLVDWVLGWVFGLIKFLLLIVVVIAIAAFVVSLVSSHDDD